MADAFSWISFRSPLGCSDDVVQSGCVERGLPLGETYLCSLVDHGHVMASVEPLDRQRSTCETTFKNPTLPDDCSEPPRHIEVGKERG
jgi:hypothetical protein